MIDNPQIGRQCWIITDIWETLCAVPVEIVAVEPDGGGIVCRWHHGRVFGGLRRLEAGRPLFHGSGGAGGDPRRARRR